MFYSLQRFNRLLQYNYYYNDSWIIFVTIAVLINKLNYKSQII